MFRKGSLYTDTGTLLRGSFASFDIRNGATPTRAQLQTMKSMGLNALHVYAESPGNEMTGCGYSAGAKLNQVRNLNSLLREEGLYLILTIGNGCTHFVFPPNTPAEGERMVTQYALDFWNLYAAEFGGDTNVIFEIYNEPYFYFNQGVLIAQPSTTNTRSLMAQAYSVIRNHAPQTPVLLFSYGTLRDASAVNADIEAVNQQILGLGKTMSNWGIAFHPYEVEPTTMAIALRTLLDQGRSLVMTELQTIQNANVPGYCNLPGKPSTPLCVSRDLVQLFETLEISWLSFVSVGNLSAASFKDQIDYGINGASILWTPDFGTWPSLSTPPATGSIITLRSNANALWVSAARTGGIPGTTPLTADKMSVTASEEFEVLRLGNRVCLKSRANNKFVDPGWGLTTPFLVASKTGCRAEYSFEWLVTSDGKLVLRALHSVTTARDRPSWRIISTNYNFTFPELSADRLLLGPWEKFDFSIRAP